MYDDVDWTGIGVTLISAVIIATFIAVVGIIVLYKTIKDIRSNKRKVKPIDLLKVLFLVVILLYLGRILLSL